MDYRRTYQLLIDKRRNNPLPDGEYGEVHHIVPKSEGGSDEPDNLVKLTAREHYVAHLLLARIYNDFKMWSAVWRMSNVGGVKITSRIYEIVRMNFRLAHSKRMAGHKSFNKGMKWWNNGVEEGWVRGRCLKITDETRSKMRKSHIGHSPANKGKPCSEEQKEKLRRANLGKKQSEETIQKRVQKLRGQKRSEETRRKIKERLKGRPNPNKGKKGKPCSEETKMKLSAIVKAWWKAKKKKEAK